MLVAIIDTGVMSGFFPVGPIVLDLEVTPAGFVRRRRSSICSFHGTMVAAILKLYSDDCQICSIKLFDDDTETATCRMLCSALRWCLSKNIPFINVSAGCLEPSEFMKIGRVIQSLHENNQTVVAAYERNNVPVMPAGHETAIGVKTDPSLHDGEYFLDKNPSKRDYVASSQHKLHFLTGEDTIITAPATSFAAPLVTAVLVNEASKHCVSG